SPTCHSTSPKRRLTAFTGVSGSGKSSLVFGTIAANSRSTVGTATDAYAMLRIIFSRLGKPYAGTSSAFSFNHAEGMCPACEGLGRVSDLDIDQLVDVDRSLNEGA